MSSAYIKAIIGHKQKISLDFALLICYLQIIL